MSYITDPNPYDVLLGRGLIVNSFSGNIFFRHLVNEYAEEYATTSNRKRKHEISKTIFSLICEDKGGRFLRELKTKSERAIVGFNASSFERTTINSGVWIPVDEATSLIKIKHALRDVHIAHQKMESSATAEEVQSFGLNQDTLPLASDTAAATLDRQESFPVSTTTTTTTTTATTSVSSGQPTHVQSLSNVGFYHNSISNTTQEMNNDRNNADGTSAYPNQLTLGENLALAVATLIVRNNNLDVRNRIRLPTDVSQTVENIQIPNVSSSFLLPIDNLPHNTILTAPFIGPNRQGNDLGPQQEIHRQQQPILDQNNSLHPTIGIFPNPSFAMESSATQQHSSFSSFPYVPQQLQRIQMQNLTTVGLNLPFYLNNLTLQELLPRTQSTNVTALLPNLSAIRSNENGYSLGYNQAQVPNDVRSCHLSLITSIFRYLQSVHDTNTQSPTSQIRMPNSIESQSSSTSTSGGIHQLLQEMPTVFTERFLPHGSNQLGDVELSALVQALSSSFAAEPMGHAVAPFIQRFSSEPESSRRISTRPVLVQPTTSATTSTGSSSERIRRQRNQTTLTTTTTKKSHKRRKG